VELSRVVFLYVCLLQDYASSVSVTVLLRKATPIGIPVSGPPPALYIDQIEKTNLMASVISWLKLAVQTYRQYVDSCTRGLSLVIYSVLLTLENGIANFFFNQTRLMRLAQWLSKCI